jgi:hypothetical protein
MNGHAGLAVAIITSQWFSLALLVFGLVYLFVAGEVERPIRRHPGWLILGWTVFGFFALAFWSVLLVGYTAVHLPTKEIVTQVENQRRVTEGQHQRLFAALDHVPPGQTYRVWFAVITNCAECAVYEADIADAWNTWGRSHGWSVGGGRNSQLAPRRGVTLCWNTKQCPEAALVLIGDALNAADIRYGIENMADNFNASIGVDAGECPILVGTP